MLKTSQSAIVTITRCLLPRSLPSKQTIQFTLEGSSRKKEKTHLHMIRNQMPALAPGTIHQHSAEVVGLFGDAMRGALQALFAGEGHVVAGLLRFALGDGFFVALHPFRVDRVAVCERVGRARAVATAAFGAVEADTDVVVWGCWCCIVRFAQERRGRGPGALLLEAEGCAEGLL